MIIILMKICRHLQWTLYAYKEIFLSVGNIYKNYQNFGIFSR